MIVISGALVVVALILLVIGLAIGSLGFVYASIGVSILSFASLLVGVLQRRRESVPGSEGAAPAAAPAASTEDGASVAPVRRASAASDLTGSVLVVEGRPRYHVAGCRYLTGKTAESVEVGTALAQGFSACGVCKPDEALTAAGASADAPAAEETAAIAAPEEIVPARAAKAGRLVKAPTGSTARTSASESGPAKKAAAKAAPAKTAAAAKAPAKKAPATKAPAKKAPATRAAATKAPAKRAPARKAAATKTAAKRAPAKKAAAKKAPAKKAARR